MDSGTVMSLRTELGMKSFSDFGRQIFLQGF